MPWEAARFVVASRATRVSVVVERVRACADAILSVCGIVRMEMTRRSVRDRRSSKLQGKEKEKNTMYECLKLVVMTTHQGAKLPKLPRSDPHLE